LNRLRLHIDNLSRFNVFLIIMLLALGVRIIFLAQISDSPFFNLNIIDEYTYSDHARVLAENGEIREGFFWQGSFYPFFLAAVYRLAGTSIQTVKIIQIIIGSLTAALVYLLGEKVFGRKTGITAALIITFCGPMLIFESKLLATCWASLFSVLLVLLFIRADKKKSTGNYLALGICCGLAIITRANFIFFISPALILLFINLSRSQMKPSMIALKAAALTGAIVLILIPVSTLSYRTNSNFNPLPQSSSLNIYLGNNPNTARTLMIRPGMEWRELIREPSVNGAATNREKREYFSRQVREYVASRPLHFLAGLGWKTVQFFSSRELPRNIDPYIERKFSSLYSILIWKKGGFGFPFGIILILAIIGLAKYGRTSGKYLWLFLVLYPVSIAAVFVASRYRVPYIPILAVPAAAGITAIAEMISRTDYRRMISSASMAGLIALAVTAPGPFAVEEHDYESEMYCNAGFVLYRENRLSEAAGYLEKSLDIRPGYSKANKYMGLLLSRMNRTDQAVDYFRKALKAKPESRFINYYLGVNLLETGRHSEAIPLLEKSFALATEARDNFMASRIRQLLERYQEYRKGFVRK